jgi:meso-butanediol dehydrogenase / (S,S)-butanediol dehydrogenase / diacetyl reductase
MPASRLAEERPSVYQFFVLALRGSFAPRSEAMTVELKGKNAIVTGSARGIGRGIALKLAEAGANVACVDLGNPSDRSLTYNLAAQTDLLSTVEQIKRSGVKVLPVLADVTSFADCQRMAAETVKQFGSIDVLVNNAGIIAVGPVADFSEEQWDRVMAVNAKGPFLCSKACIPHMLKNKEGAIINTASIAGKTGRGGAAAYCASKFAVVAFTQALAEELGPSNIRVNAVCPGFLRTAMWTDVLNKVPGLLGRGEGDSTVDNLTHVAVHGTYLRREQTPEDIGEAVVYLARADNITGETINVAGGAEVH